jgi:hypothetical protein
MDGLDDGLRFGCQESVDLMRPRNGLQLRASITFEDGPDPRKREQRAILVQGKPHHVFFLRGGVWLWGVFGEAVGRYEAAALWLQPRAPRRPTAEYVLASVQCTVT